MNTQTETIENINQMPVLDDDLIHELLIYTSSEVLLSIVDSFWKSCDLLLKDIEKAISSQNTSLLSSSAHALKGAAANMGALRLSKLAHNLQTAPLAEANQYYQEILSTISITKDPLQHRFSSQKEQ